MLHSRLNAVVTIDVESPPSSWIDATRNDDRRWSARGLLMTVKDAATAACGQRAERSNLMTMFLPKMLLRSLMHATPVLSSGANRTCRVGQATFAVNEMSANRWPVGLGHPGVRQVVLQQRLRCLTPSRSEPTLEVQSDCPPTFRASAGINPHSELCRNGYIDHVTHTLDADVNVIGPLARTVDDLELMLMLFLTTPSGFLRLAERT